MRASADNSTGLPEQLKTGIETLSGLSMDHVKVHYNSARPAQLHAHAYAQGSDLHSSPGQERHLPHEAWHVVQQALGGVQPTMPLENGGLVNDDAGLEREATISSLLLGLYCENSLLAAAEEAAAAELLGLEDDAALGDEGLGGAGEEEAAGEQTGGLVEDETDLLRAAGGGHDDGAVGGKGEAGIRRGGESAAIERHIGSVVRRLAKPNKLYRQAVCRGFDLSLPVQGARYTAPAAKTRILGLTDGSNQATATWVGDAVAPAVAPAVSQVMTITTAIKAVIAINPATLKVTIAPATGLITGDFKLPGTNVLAKYEAIIEGDAARGFYITPAPHRGVVKRFGTFELQPGEP